MAKSVEVLVVGLLLVFLTASAGNLFVSDNTQTQWYEETKPVITPPNIVFPIVWSILYVFIAVAIYLSWIHAKKSQKKTLAILFAINLITNAAWSYLFFELRNPAIAFADLIVMFSSTIFLIYKTNKISKTARNLLIPYALWLAFAGVINFLYLI